MILKADEYYAQTATCFECYLSLGGYPALWGNDVTEKDATDWLYNYVQTYLQRDIRDLAEMRNLEPFVQIQQISARLTGQLVNYSSLARESGITSKTAQRFLQFLQMSYQVIILPPWHRNPLKRLTKTPKLHYLDPGVQSAVSQRYGALSGNEFESAVVSEIIKQSRKVTSSDARHLKQLHEILDKPLLHSFVVSNDTENHLSGKKHNRSQYCCIAELNHPWSAAPPAGCHHTPDWLKAKFVHWYTFQSSENSAIYWTMLIYKRNAHENQIYNFPYNRHADSSNWLLRIDLL